MPRLSPYFSAIYAAFNDRDIEAVLPHLHPEVTWANSQFGGYVHSDAVRQYWTEQFKVTRSILEPLSREEAPDGRSMIKVHITIEDAPGSALAKKDLRQTFTVHNGHITRFDILEDQ